VHIVQPLKPIKKMYRAIYFHTNFQPFKPITKPI
jgi:hypothetical protein